MTARDRRGNSTQRVTEVSSGRGNDDWREEQAGDHRAVAVGSAWCGVVVVLCATSGLFDDQNEAGWLKASPRPHTHTLSTRCFDNVNKVTGKIGCRLT